MTKLGKMNETRWGIRIIRMGLGVIFLLGGITQAKDSLTVRIDTGTVALRSFDSEALEAYKAEAEFQYQEEVKIDKESWLARLSRQIREFLFGEDGARGVTFFRILVYLIGIAALILIVLGLLKIRITGIFGKSARKTGVAFEELNEDIHEMDFDQLVQEAVDQGNFRRAVRLHYLRSLKVLSDRELIEWRPYKTNHDYQTELRTTPWAKDFDELTRDFEYVWYGDFSLNSEEYQSVASVFKDFQQKLGEPA